MSCALEYLRNSKRKMREGGQEDVEMEANQEEETEEVDTELDEEKEEEDKPKRKRGHSSKGKKEQSSGGQFCGRVDRFQKQLAEKGPRKREKKLLEDKPKKKKPVGMKK